jgi:hypothetical protein
MMGEVGADFEAIITSEYPGLLFGLGISHHFM